MQSQGDRYVCALKAESLNETKKAKEGRRDKVAVYLHVAGQLVGQL